MEGGRLGCPEGLGELGALLEKAVGKARAVDALAVLLVVKREDRVGRPRLSRLLGLGDRRVRNLVDTLERLSLLSKSRGGSSLTPCSLRLLRPASCLDVGGYTCCRIEGYAMREDRVVRARDEVALRLGEPDRLVVIGWYSGGGGVRVPGAPPEALEGLQGVLGRCGGGGVGGSASVYALFRGEGCYRCCASFIQAAFASSLLIEV